MKKYLLLFTVLLLIGVTSCQKKTDIAREKEAIMAVIQAESETARDGNFEGITSCYVQDELNTRLTVSEESYSIITGWDELVKLFEPFKSNAEQDYSNLKVSKENAVIKVMGNTAWLICDNIWKGEIDSSDFKSETLQVTFLEKVEGEWKISFAAWIAKPKPADVVEEPQAEE
ncbi:MAG: nuclear transport factor 2 family protein [Bacteroidales bacterium]|nr:nuclear transport factor 2 family protein [Bacteroidales bacterium]